MTRFAFSLVMLCVLVSAQIADSAEPPKPMLTIDGPPESKPYRLVELVATNAQPDAALIWDVSPEDTADVRELPGGRLVMTGPPGTYKVKLRAIRFVDGKTSAESARMTLVITGTNPIVPKPNPTLDPVQATGRLKHGNSGCTATVIYPRRPDGRWDVVTANHCTGGVGSAATLALKDGRTLALTVTAVNRTADVSWLYTVDASIEALPCAMIAETDPTPGTAIWHNGYGVDRPGNREDGEVSGPVTGNGFLPMHLSVSPGDSGGGIFRTDNGELIAVVSATTRFAEKASMYGCCASVARAVRPK